MDLPISIWTFEGTHPANCSLGKIEITSFLNEYERDWRHLLFFGKETEEDISWDWNKIFNEECREEDGFLHLGIRYNNLWQAVIILKAKERMRLLGVGEAGTLVEYFAVAPWNRSTVRLHHPLVCARLAPLGSWLMWAATMWSLEVGNQGRLCWESKAKAEKSYLRMFPSVKTTGPQGPDRLRWMETDPRDADAFCSRFAKREDASWESHEERP